MKTKVEFTIVEHIEKQINDWNMTDEEVRHHILKKEYNYGGYIKKIEKAIRDKLEFEDYTIIEDFKAGEMEDEDLVEVEE